MLELLRPTYTLPQVEDLPYHGHILDGIKLVAFDVDGTLANYHELPDTVVKRMLASLGRAGFDLCVISNAYNERALELQTKLGDVYNMPIVTPETVAASGSDPRRYRKPSPEMLLHAMKYFAAKPDQTLMVGDQIFKDIVSANRAGTKSLLVPRRGNGDHPGVRLQRFPEMLVRSALDIRFDEAA